MNTKILIKKSALKDSHLDHHLYIGIHPIVSNEVNITFIISPLPVRNSIYLIIILSLLFIAAIMVFHLYKLQQNKTFNDTEYLLESSSIDK
jgi:hypothetical protein